MSFVPFVFLMNIIKITSFTLSDGFPEEPKCFYEKCLLTSCIFGYYQYEKFDSAIPETAKRDEKQLTTYDRLCRLNDRAKFGTILQNKAGRELKNILNELTAKLNIPLEGPHKYDETLTILADHFKSQIHLITGSQESKAHYQSFPSKYDDRLPQIFLFKVSDSHVVHIQNLKKFFKDNRTICFYCRQTVSSKINHKCRLNSCPKCTFPRANSCTKQLSYLPFKYCDSDITENKVEQKCSKCLQIFETIACFKGHLFKCGSQQNEFSKWGQICQQCFKFISFRQPGKHPAEILEEHRCASVNHRVCKFCRHYFPTSERHACKVRKKEATKVWPNLIFFNFEYRNLTSLNCDKCQQLKLNYLSMHNLTELQLLEDKNFPLLTCQSHQSPQKDSLPNVAVIWRESDRGIFEEYVLTEANLDNKVDHTSDVFKFTYFTEDNRQPYVTKTPIHYKQNAAITKSFYSQLETKLASKKRTIIYKFLQLVTQSGWQNSTLISWNDKFSQLGDIIEALITLGCIPRILHKRRKLFSVILENLNLRFINACNYFSGHLHDVASQYGINFTKNFFPNR